MYRSIRINLVDNVEALGYLCWVAARVYNKALSLIRKRRVLPVASSPQG